MNLQVEKNRILGVLEKIHERMQRLFAFSLSISCTSFQFQSMVNKKATRIKVKSS